MLWRYEAVLGRAESMRSGAAYRRMEACGGGTKGGGEGG
jgi:hypothetical protein